MVAVLQADNDRATAFLAISTIGNNVANTHDPVVILGAGGHGRVCAEIAQEQGLSVAGFLDVALAPGAHVNGLPILGRELVDLKAHHPPGSVSVFVAVGSNRSRVELFELACKAGYGIATLKHPRAIVSGSAFVGPGSVLMAGVVVNANAVVGRYCILNTCCSIDHDNVLEDGVQICPGVRSPGAVHFEAGAFVGTAAVLRPAVRVGRNACVGAGAVVLHDVPPEACVVGNPARAIRK